MCVLFIDLVVGHRLKIMKAVKLLKESQEQSQPAAPAPAPKEGIFTPLLYREFVPLFFFAPLVDISVFFTSHLPLNSPSRS